MNEKRTSVIIVDDNDIMRGLLRSILRGEAYEVVGEARNGHAAVDLVDRLRPAVVCMDVIMPEKNGIEALCEIKAKLPATAVVMITGNSDPETVQEAIGNGASGFIIKPFNAARVLDTLNKVVQRLNLRHG